MEHSFVGMYNGPVTIEQIVVSLAQLVYSVCYEQHGTSNHFKILYLIVPTVSDWLVTCCLANHKY